MYSQHDYNTGCQGAAVGGATDPLPPIPDPAAPLGFWDAWYAALGIPIVHCHWITERGICSCREGIDCPKPGKHPLTRHGCYDGTADLAILSDRRRRWPRANISAATGPDRLFDVFDVDHHDLDAWQEATGYRLPHTWRWRTGSGNWQLAFKPAPGLTNRVRQVPYGDVRCKGGLAILPTSRNRNGAYAWVVPPTEAPLADWPADLLAALMPPKLPPPSLAPKPAGVAAAIPSSLTRWAEKGAPLGQQTHCAFWLACRLRQHGADEAEGWALMERFAAACTPPAHLPKVARIWHDSAKYQGYQPFRRLPEPHRPRAIRLPDAVRPIAGTAP